ncbi:MAG TPA: S-adenosylmethionine:tRNA ribosyltransferase-isomerase [Gemmatimonadales bacterium]|nr:S-adenosylmethionine:tRNA ribosyltransferase-isomerase [Gemmatimonadales bacterium]
MSLPLQLAPARSTGRLHFDLPQSLAAAEPPEARGLARDDVRLMVSRATDNSIIHRRFHDFPDFLSAGDVLVVNISATINAAIVAWRQLRGERELIELHLSTPLPDGRWVVELRHLTDTGTAPLFDARAGVQVRLAGGGRAVLNAPFRPVGGHRTQRTDRVRLWIAELDCPGGVMAHFREHGSPIRYEYVRRPWPLAFYQTVFADEPGSAEMPSAGRPFTHEIVERLNRRGVTIAPVLLHTGVASLEDDEPPYPERYRVAETTANLVNRGRALGGRVVAVGTTVVRALETAATPDGRVRAAAGWTDLVVTPDRGIFVVDAILTGLHAPRASHLAMLEALAGRDHLDLAYRSALRHRYLWHEFGDVHLMFGVGRGDLGRDCRFQRAAGRPPRGSSSARQAPG